jgi:hypothetical protein
VITSDLTYIWEDEPYEEGSLRIFAEFPHKSVHDLVDRIMLPCGLKILNSSVSLETGAQDKISSAPTYHPGPAANWYLACEFVPFKYPDPHTAGGIIYSCLQDIRFFDGKWGFQVARVSYKERLMWVHLILTDDYDKLHTSPGEMFLR